jgi:hypothetical protein
MRPDPAASPAPSYTALAVTVVTLALAYGVWYAYSVFLVALLREFGGAGRCWPGPSRSSRW